MKEERKMRWTPGKAVLQPRLYQETPSEMEVITPWQEKLPPWQSLVYNLEVGKEVTTSWGYLSPLPRPLHGTELGFTGRVFQETLGCPTVQLKPSLLLRSRNVPVSLQIWVTIQGEPGPALPHQPCSSCRPWGFWPPTLYRARGQKQDSVI